MTQKRTPTSPRRHLKHAVRQAVVPHAHNDYRPHLIRLPSIVAIVLGLLLFQMTYNLVQTGSVLGQTTDITSQDLLGRTNDERVKTGEGALQLNSQLARAAALKADDMFENQYWSHVSPSGETPWKWFAQAGYDYANAGENLAKDFHTTGGLVTAWMNSADHRANILDVRYSEVGFAVKSGQLNGQPTTVVVALYGTPEATPIVAGAATTAAASGSQSLISRLGVGLQSMTPALVGSVFILALMTLIALVAHSYRSKLPNSWRRNWKRHHGAYTALSTMSLLVVVVTLYGGGQI